LVRYGVAPDHQDVKNVINSFTETIKQENVQFYGNVNIGHDLKISELLKAYDGVVLAYGSHSENYLNVPGESKFKNIISAKDFVGWYNGLPENKNLNIDLSCSHAIIIGAGNVALDIARILLSAIEKLHKTDITSDSLEQIKTKNKINKVTIVARRSVFNAAFTLKELREITKLDNVFTNLDLKDFDNVKMTDLLNKLDRPRKRLVEYMYDIAKKNANIDNNKEKTLSFRFLYKPLEITGSLTAVEEVKFQKSSFKFDETKPYDIDSLIFTDTNEIRKLGTGLLIRSIGYKNVNIDNTEIPFDKKLGVIPNENGKVSNKNGLYCTGWIKRGPKGVIVDTTSDAYETADQLCKDLSKIEVKSGKVGGEEIINLLKSRNVNVVDKNGWLKIDNEEIKRGKLVGKPREKLSSVEEMLKVAFSN
jgi:adrenodoxin-NADP+ reductase